MGNDSADAPAAALDYQPASLDIWDRKYRLRRGDGTPVDRDIDDTFRRIARALAELEEGAERQERWNREFLWALRHGAIPAGRIIANAGAGDLRQATSTINCTVSGTIHDSMDSILTRLREAGLTLKAGCGIGYEFSTLRPKGAYVSGPGSHTSGPLSFMDIYDRMCRTISSAGGRRGAQMATFDIGHPDVADFIRAKREPGRLRQFNLSLLITEGFMQAVETDADWPLAFPLSEHELEQGGIDLADPQQVLWRHWPVTEGYRVNERGEVACRIYRTVPARELWELIMRSTYDYAEPGFILIDRVNELNNNWWCEEIRATNPCVTADTWVQTTEGPRQVRQLVGRSFTAIVDGKAYRSGKEGFFSTGTRKVLTLCTVEGYRLRLTADHPLRRVSRESRDSIESGWCKAGALRPGDRVLLNDHRQHGSWEGGHTWHEGYVIGLLMGDGTLKQDKAVLSAWVPQAVANGRETRATPGVLSVMEEAERAARRLPHRADFTGWIPVPGRSEYRMATSAIRELALRLGLRPGAKRITETMEQASSEFYRGFLRGFFDADGSVQGSQDKGVSIRLAQSDRERLEAVQRMLLRLGIASRLYLNRRREGERLLPDGKGGAATFATKAQHELVISGDNIRYYAERIGFSDSTKAGHLEYLLGRYRRGMNRERFLARVEAVLPAGEEAVFDVRVPGRNAFDANGFHAHNCGEQPLPPYGSCLLGSVNLTRFVREPFTERAAFDWETFRRVVAIFTRMLDNVVEINGLPLEQQRREILEKRRHGMGFLGLGSALAMLRIRYGSPGSLEFTETVARELALTGWEQALELAREKGPAPVLARDYEVTEEMLRLRPELERDGYRVGDEVPGRILHARYSRYMQKIAAVRPDLVEALAETGARFTHHSSIAPTGTISLSLANNASNGIEPSFAHHYVRNIIVEGKKTKEPVDVWSYELLAWRALVDPQASPDEGLPEWFVTADRVTPQEHVDIQAAAQKWIDSSISKTINVPTDLPFEAFHDIYHYAYRKGLKGCTTFRFNPEAFQGVLVREEDLENTVYRFELEDGRVIEVKGNEEVEYDGEVHTAANLFDALKEGYYGKL
ncbi:MAG: ribonucleoside-diphosphate reductase [Gammaproteobacteria bacterium]|nr:MAG: ribonucleoside-diphosphate reductase [Gammaproteobacteria bacterium]